MEDLLSSALILVACISAGVSACFIARGRSSINKHSRQRIKDFESDIKYLADSKKEEAVDYRKEIMRLKVMNTKQQEGLTTITDKDMKNSGLGEVIMKLIPAKYRGIAGPIAPMIEKAVKDDPTLLKRVYDKLQSANSGPSKSPGQVEATATL